MQTKQLNFQFLNLINCCMLQQISEYALIKKGLIYFENLLSFQISMKNKNLDICQGFSNILQETAAFFPSGCSKWLKA